MVQSKNNLQCRKVLYSTSIKYTHETHSRTQLFVPKMPLFYISPCLSLKISRQQDRWPVYMQWPRSLANYSWCYFLRTLTYLIKAHERNRQTYLRHSQVRPWTVTDSTCRLALARCGRSGPVQAWWLVLQSTDVSTTKRRSIWSTAAFQSQTSPVVSDYVPHVVACW